METRHARSNDSNPSAILTTGGDQATLAAPGARLPIPVMLIWVCAFAGLAAYTASWFVPSLAR